MGPLTLHTYGLFIALGVLAGTHLMIYRAKQRGMPAEAAQDAYYSLTFHALVAGFLGARLLYVITFWDQFADQWPALFKVWEGGLVFYGGLIGGSAGFVLWKKRHPDIPWFQALDIAAPAMAAGHALGRLGCFFAGCCYGRPTDVPWAVMFTHADALAPLGIPLHPAQIYEFLFLCALAAYLSIRSARSHADGAVFIDYLTLYPIGRFAVEFYRADPPMMAGLSSGQIVSIVMVIVSIVIRMKLSKARDA